MLRQVKYKYNNFLLFFDLTVTEELSATLEIWADDYVRNVVNQTNNIDYTKFYKSVDGNSFYIRTIL